MDNLSNRYEQRAEEELKQNRYREAINEINHAINNSEDNYGYKLKKLLILKEAVYRDITLRRDGISFIKENIKEFYNKMELKDFMGVIEYYNMCFKDNKSDIFSLFREIGLPIALLSNVYIGKLIDLDVVADYIENCVKEENVNEALYHMEIIESKGAMTSRMYTLKGNMLSKLDEKELAKECYEMAKALGTKKDVETSSVEKNSIKSFVDKYKKEITIGVGIVAVIFIVQFFMFKSGIIPSKLSSHNIDVIEGLYIKENNNNLILPVNETVEIDINYKLKPFYGSKGNISYEVEDESVISYDGTNKISTHKEGITNFNIIKDGKQVHKFEIMVVKSQVENIKLELSSQVQSIGDESHIITDVIRDYDFDVENEIVYTSTDEEILEIEDDRVIAVGVGKASIVASCQGYSTEREVVISPRLLGMIVEEEIELEVGDKQKLEVEVKMDDEDAVPPKVMFKFLESESDEKVIEIDAEGEITAFSEGSQDILVRCADIEKQVTINVKEKPIDKLKVENIEHDAKIESDHLNINLTWDSLDISDNHLYEIYMKDGLISGYELIEQIPSNGDSRMSANISIDVSEKDGDILIPMYIIASNSNGESKKSETIYVKAKYENPEDITDSEISNFRDESVVRDNHVEVQVSWEALPADVTYYVYVRNNLTDEDFKLKEKIKGKKEGTVSANLGHFSEEIDLDVYVNAKNKHGKTKDTETINIKY